MKSPIERFYDQFSRTFVRDYVLGNRRVDRQIEFFRATLPHSAKRILVIGCGSGESARAVARSRDAHILAVDLSDENLRLARMLHPHRRITYEKLDVTANDVPGRFEAILLPDVYEHIPASARPQLHAKLRAALADTGRILITIPSVGKQTSLAGTDALQIIDETVTIDDLLALARDVDGELVYFNLISVWEAHDYVHAIIGRGAAAVSPLSTDATLPVDGWPAGLKRSFDDVRPLRLVARGTRALIRLARLHRRSRRNDRDE